MLAELGFSVAVAGSVGHGPESYDVVVSVVKDRGLERFTGLLFLGVF